MVLKSLTMVSVLIALSGATSAMAQIKDPPGIGDGHLPRMGEADRKLMRKEIKSFHVRKNITGLKQLELEHIHRRQALLEELQTCLQEAIDFSDIQNCKEQEQWDSFSSHQEYRNDIRRLVEESVLKPKRDN